MNEIIFSLKRNASFYCERLEFDKGDKIYIGFGNDFQNIVMIIFSFFGIFINLYFFISSIKKIIISSKTGNTNLSSIEKILCVISITETFISICWLINSLAMKTTDELISRCNACRVIGNIELFFYVFDWMILSSTLFQIKKMLTNPLETLKTEKNIIKYIIFCAVFGVFNVILGYFADVEGVSPMLTCFIDIVGWEYEDNEKGIKTFFYVMFFFIPICILLYGIYQVYEIVKLPEFKNNKNNRKFFKSYLLYIFTYIILALLLISVYIIDYFLKQKIPNSAIQFYIKVVTILSCSTPLIVGTFRLVKTRLIQKLFFCNKDNNIDYNQNKSLISKRKESTDSGDNNFMEFEQDIICTEFKKIFIAISFILDKSKQLEDDQNEKELEQTDNNIKEEINLINLNTDNNIINNEKQIDNDITYIINKDEILKDFDLHLNDDIFILNQKEINIEIKEYLPKYFKKLRKLDNLKEDKLAEYFQPKNVTSDLFKKTNDSNYYINSTNKQFILKSINLEQIEFFKTHIKNAKIDEYFSKNNDSIINRVYGLYFLKIDKTKNYFIALMENIYESIDKDLILNKPLKINESQESSFEIEISKDKNSELKMSLNEIEINERIIKNGDGDEENEVEIPLNRKKSLQKKQAFFGTEKKFNIILDESEYNRLKRIIEKDIEFLQKTGNNRTKFLVVEKRVNNNIWNNLFYNHLVILNNNNDNVNNISGIKKYIFKSINGNIIYCITISSYFNNISE